MIRHAFGVLMALVAPGVLGAKIVDSTLKYTLELPSGWVQIYSVPGERHVFNDTTEFNKSVISIEIFPIAGDSIPTPEAWVRYNFLAYKLAVENSVFPFGAVVYFDSSHATTLSGLWSPELYSDFYFHDGTPTKSEYVRYAATGGYGYEIVAYGDSSDMANNIVYYADSIIATFQFIGSGIGIIGSHGRSLKRNAGLMPPVLVDALGRGARERPRHPFRILYSGPPRHSGP